MRSSKKVKQLAVDLELSEVDTYVMELKAKLYLRSSKLIQGSAFTHEEIAKKIGTSRSRINRIANLGENSLSIEILIKIITLLEGKSVFRIA